MKPGLLITDVRGALREAMAQLRAGSVPSPALAAELLLMHVLGRDRAWLYAHPEELLDASSAERYFELVARRIRGVPTQYLTGRQEFWGLEFEVEPGVLIPRPETEHVVEAALECAGHSAGQGDVSAGTGLAIADVGTGSGCIAVALARELPGARVIATDISAPALGVARRNAARHNVTARLQLVQCNLLEAFLPTATPADPFARPFHLIVSNPPYVGRREAEILPREVREHEPDQALFGGELGDEVYKPLIGQAEQLLRPGGHLVLELGHGALERVLPLLAASTRWARVGVTPDLAGIARVLAAERLGRG